MWYEKPLKYLTDNFCFNFDEKFQKDTLDLRLGWPLVLIEGVEFFFEKFDNSNNKNTHQIQQGEQF